MTTTLETAPINFSTLNIAALARVIRRDWAKVYFGAAPYLQAMATIDKASDSYGYDSGKSIIRYFLAKASTYRGPMAKAIKAELKRRLSE
jgi:hypothetical protein